MIKTVYDICFPSSILLSLKKVVPNLFIILYRFFPKFTDIDLLRFALM